MRRSIALALLAVAVTACGGNSGPGTLSAGAAQTDLAPVLLDEADVADAPGAPSGLDGLSLDRADLTVDPDPRGPCGASIPPLPYEDGAIRAFGRSDVLIVQLVVPDAGELSERIIGSARADLRVGCPEFTKATPSGASQRTRLVREIPLPGTGDDGVAFLSEASVEGGETVFAAQGLVRTGDALLVLVAFTAEPLPDPFFGHVAGRAVQRLEDPSP